MMVGAGVSALLAMAVWHEPQAQCASGCSLPVAEQSAAPQTLPVGAEPQPVPAATPTPVPEDQGAGEVEHIVVSGRRHARYDPLENVNKVSFEVVQKVDKAVVGPVAQEYERVVPSPVRDGVHNMVHNLREPYIAINFLLQHRVGKSAETVARFLINSTVGVAGLFDIAKRKPIKLPRRANGFADTMAFYGVGSGPYLYLPVIGPTTVRDMLGNTLDRLVIPLSVGRLVHNRLYAAPLIVFGAMDKRLEKKASIEAMRAAQNPYVARREEYLARRRAEIEGLHYHRPRKDAATPEPKEP